MLPNLAAHGATRKIGPSLTFGGKFDLHTGPQAVVHVRHSGGVRMCPASLDAPCGERLTGSSQSWRLHADNAQAEGHLAALQVIRRNLQHLLALSASGCRRRVGKERPEVKRLLTRRMGRMGRRIINRAMRKGRVSLGLAIASPADLILRSTQDSASTDRYCNSTATWVI